MLVMLDKDNTLVQPLLGEGFISHPRDQRLMPGVADRVRELKAAGVTMVICSNQGGCEAINKKTGKPYKTIADAMAELHYCLELLPEIEIAYFCPDLKGVKVYGIYKGWETFTSHGEYSFRKPAPGMLLLAMEQVADTFATFVGDQESDSLAAKAAGVPFVWAEEWWKDSKVVF